MLQYLTTSFIALFEPLRDTWIWPGLVEVGKFLGTHLISGMLPAFFIAGAIAVFLDKQRITKLMGAKANPLIAYPVAAFQVEYLPSAPVALSPFSPELCNREPVSARHLPFSWLLRQ